MMPFEEIREHYNRLTPMILNSTLSAWVDPYCHIQWDDIFSPIEKDAWMSIRGFGKAPFYPQYPVGLVFIDFANPYIKIGIECDGKEWHDQQKDFKRDSILLKSGWSIFRVSGSDCVRVSGEYHDRFACVRNDRDVLDVLEKYYRTLDGLIKAVAIFYFGYEDYSFFEMEMPLAIDCIKHYASTASVNMVMQYVNHRYELASDIYK